MKKIVVLLLMILPLISSAQKAMVGYTEEEIRESNKEDFPEVNLKREYFREFWVLKGYIDGVEGVYFFHYGIKENFMCAQSIREEEKAENYFLHLKTRCKKVEDFIYFDPDSDLFMKVDVTERGKIIFIWTKEKLE
jgi:hypothetical protein